MDRNQVAATRRAELTARAKSKAVMVARVSTSGQTDNTSFETQRQAAIKKAKELGFEIVHFYEETESGAGYLTRAETQQAIRDIEAGRACNIIFYDFSRFSRDAEFQQLMKKRIESAGGKLILCSHDFGDSAEGNLAFGVFGSFAAYEREVINRRCSNGRQRKLESGVMVYRTNAAFGYRVIRKDDIIRGTHTPEQEGKYEIIEEQAQWVRKIFDQYAAGHTTNSICRYLYENGCRTTKGGIWDRSNISDMIKRTIYKGRCAVNKTRQYRDESRLSRGLSAKFVVELPEDQWIFIPAPAIVSDEVWEAANSRLNDGRKNSGRPEKRHTLAGLLPCPQCGRQLSGRFRTKRNKTDVIYFCSYSSEKKQMQGCCAEKRAFNASKIEAMVTEALTLVATRRDMVDRVYQEYASDRSNHGSQLEHLQLSLQQLEKKETIAASKQIEAEIEGRSGNVYATILRDIAVQKTAIENQIQHAGALVDSKSAHQLKAQLVAEIIDDVTTALNDREFLSNAEKNRLMANIISHVDILESVDKGVLIALKNDGRETVEVRHLDGVVEMVIQHPFGDKNTDLKSSVGPNLHHN